MERLNNDYLESDDVLVAEHRHRYIWASGYVRGDLLDLACGYGYGAEVLAAHTNVASYVGIDASAEAVANARERFARSNRHFLVASATEIPLPDHCVDGVVSLETLEHLHEPARAVREYKRVLRPGGILVGSVPSEYFDGLAERVYGANTYHVTRFTCDELEALLRAEFSSVRVYYSALEVVTHIGFLKDGLPAPREMATVIRERPATHVSGSFHFVATDHPSTLQKQEHENQIYFCTGMVELDEIKVMPLRRLIKSNEDLVRQKDQVIWDAEKHIGARDRHISELEAQLKSSQAQLEGAQAQLERAQAQLKGVQALLPPLIWKLLRLMRPNSARE